MIDISVTKTGVSADVEAHNDKASSFVDGWFVRGMTVVGRGHITIPVDNVYAFAAEAGHYKLTTLVA